MKMGIKTELYPVILKTATCQESLQPDHLLCCAWEGKATYLCLSWDTFGCDLGLLREEFIEINLISSVSQVFALVLPFPEILMLGAGKGEN